MKYSAIYVLLLTASMAFAQSEIEDVVYLKNGSVIRGKITEQKFGESLKIELLGGSVFVFRESEIDSIKKENIRKAKLNRLKTDYYRKDRGFQNISQVGIIYGVALKNNDNYTDYYYNNNRDDIGISIHTINGYRFWSYLFVGAGVGIDRFISYRQTFSPFYVRVASEFLKRKVTPFVFVDAGYAVMWKQPSNDYQTFRSKGGAYTSAGGGIRIFTRSRASVMLSAAYRMNMSETKWWYTQWNEGTYYTIKRTYQRMVASVGVTF
ncbi:MAG: hypothetical protein KIS94_01820 [Chitinophagales bacterium]|nr:hypothetical protein [Chitinophagales bacterium]